MRRSWPFFLSGILLALAGLVWTLQGFNVLRGSAMSGSTMWAVIGPIVLIAGVVLLGVGFAVRRRRGTR